MSVPLPHLALTMVGVEIWAHFRRDGNAVSCAGYWILPEGEPLDCTGRKTAKEWNDALRIAARMGATNGESALSDLV